MLEIVDLCSSLRVNGMSWVHIQRQSQKERGQELLGESYLVVKVIRMYFKVITARNDVIWLLLFIIGLWSFKLGCGFPLILKTIK